jgi:hypothetical protein
MNIRNLVKSYGSPLLGLLPKGGFMRSVLVVLAVALLSTQAQAAAKPADVFAGRIMTSDKPYPTSTKSTSAFIAKVKKQSKNRFDQDKETGKWVIYYAAFFKKPVNDLELKLTVYNAADHTFIASWEEYLTERGQRSIIGRLDLKPEENKLDPNTKVLVTLESGGKVVASTQFYVIGEVKKHTGKQVFTDEETKEKDDE